MPAHWAECCSHHILIALGHLYIYIYTTHHYIVSSPPLSRCLEELQKENSPQVQPRIPMHALILNGCGDFITDAYSFHTAGLYAFPFAVQGTVSWVECLE